jgi:hypothetical protein
VATPAHNVEQAVARGSELLKQGNVDGAQKVFRAALAVEEGNPRLLALLGLSHFRAGQFDQARPIYEQLVERAPTDASHRLNLGLVYLKLGRADLAISALEASRALDPSQGRAVSYLGLAYARGGRYAEAYRSFLLAGQNELAKEIELNLTQAERDGIHQQLQRSGLEPVIQPAIPRTQTPPDRPSLVRSAEEVRERDRRPTKPSEPPPIREGASGAGPRASGPEPEKKPTFLEVKPEPPKPEPPKPEPPKPEPPKPEPLKIDMRTEPAKVEPPPPEAPPAVVTPPPETAVPSHEITAPRMTDSLQFVLPPATPAPVAAPDGRSMISRAVDAASAASVGATRAAAHDGNAPPIPLSQLATEHLVRADDSQHPFAVSESGALVIRVTDRVLTRLEGVHVTGGDLAYEPAQRRSRGHQIEDRFDYGGTQLHAVNGSGYLIALPGDRTFTAVTLDDDIFYLREDLVFAFEASLRWENGNVPGLRGRLPVVQFRGDGAIALRTAKPLVRVKLPSSGVLFVDATRLAGWIGRVIPRAVVPPLGGPMGDVCVECTGEGVVLVDPLGDPASLAQRDAKPKERSGPPTPPPPPAASEPGAMSAADLLGDEDF